MRTSKLLLSTGIFMAIFAACEKKEGEVNCETKSYTFDGDASIIINQKCASAGCHNSSFGGNFSSYEGVLDKVNSGEFNSQISNNLMPPSSKPQLTEEEKNILLCWGENGGVKN